MASASVAHGYFSSVPMTTKILIASPTGESTGINAGYRVGTIIPIHLKSDDSMIVGTLCMESDQSWLNFPDLCNDDLTNPTPIPAMRLATPDSK
jgi:hypothetical protein